MALTVPSWETGIWYLLPVRSSTTVKLPLRLPGGGTMDWAEVHHGSMSLPWFESVDAKWAVSTANRPRAVTADDDSTLGAIVFEAKLDQTSSSRIDSVDEWVNTNWINEFAFKFDWESFKLIWSNYLSLNILPRRQCVSYYRYGHYFNVIKVFTRNLIYLLIN